MGGFLPKGQTLAEELAKAKETGVFVFKRDNGSRTFTEYMPWERIEEVQEQ